MCYEGRLLSFSSSTRRIVFVMVLLAMIKVTFTDDFCFLPSKVGSCRAMFRRWYYNPLKGSCSKFYYGGCYGNENNFVKKSECTDKCQGFSCKTHYQAIGCFIHNHSPQFGYVLFNDRDVNSGAFSGVLIDWLRWKQYVPNMLCRCAKKAASNGFKKFAIFNLAECWGANDFHKEHFNVSSVCLDRFYGQQCKTATDMCVGGPQAHYYYNIIRK